MNDIPALKHDHDAELSVIGCLMFAGLHQIEDTQEELFEKLKPPDFFDPKLRKAFTVALEMRKAGEPIDAKLVARRCEFDNAAGLMMLAMQNVTGTALAGSYTKIVLDASMQRKIVKTALDALRGANSNGGNASEIVKQLRSDLDALEQSATTAKLTTGAQAATDYMRFLSLRDQTLPRLALPELDYALGGGVDYGEMVILAARPSHGKTAVALQCVHNWTEDGLPVLYVSLEMSASALGKRITQFSSDVPEEHWRGRIGDVQHDVEKYLDQRAEWVIADGITSIDQITTEVERAVKQRGIKACVVDYAQLIQSPGRSRYEQITHTSTVLRGLASQHRLVMLVLCQMSREIENRKKFIPIMSDIKESGQFEQDADVMVFLVWPHRINSTQPAHEYQFFVAKNRNRPILTSAFTARFEPSRQRVVSQTLQDMPNYCQEFEDFEVDRRVHARQDDQPF